MNTKINRYWVFLSDNYYPRCGMKDFHSHHSTIGEAMSALTDTIDSTTITLAEFQVFDSEIFEIVEMGYVTSEGQMSPLCNEEVNKELREKL